MLSKNKKYVIEVDGGGTKTVVASADLTGKVVAQVRTGSAHPRNIGIKKAIANVVLAIDKVLPKEGKALSTFLGLPSMEEEFKFKKEIRKFAPRVGFIRPKLEPVMGTVKLAIEELKNENFKG